MKIYTENVTCALHFSLNMNYFKLHNLKVYNCFIYLAYDKLFSAAFLSYVCVLTFLQLRYETAAV